MKFLLILFQLIIITPCIAQLKDVYNAFEKDIEKVRLHYYQQLEYDNGKEMLKYLDDLNNQADNFISKGSFRDLPAEFFDKMRYYKKLTGSLEFFLTCASGNPAEKTFEEFRVALDYLDLTYSLVQKINCGKVFKVSFGNPVYTLYFFKNDAPERHNKVNYQFKGYRNIQGKWIYNEILNGNFVISVNHIEGFARFREVSSFKGIELTSIYCTEVNY